MPAVVDVEDLLSAGLDALSSHQRRAARIISLVPTENAGSRLAGAAYGTDAAARAFFNIDGEPGGWTLPSRRHAARIETDVTLPLLHDATGASYVSARPLSGTQSTTLVLASLDAPAGATVLIVHAAHEGVCRTARLVRRMRYTDVHVRHADPYRPDPAALAAATAAHRPALILFEDGGLFPLPLAELLTATGAARTHVDISATMPLIFGGLLPNPLHLGADSIGGSTHTAFPGPQHGVLAMRTAPVAEAVFAAERDLIASHHLAAVCALGLALAEFQSRAGLAYARAIVRTARALGDALAAAGLPPLAADRGYTGGHQLWVDTRTAGLDAARAGERLAAGGIDAEIRDDLPGLGGAPALSLGVAEAVHTGLTESHTPRLAALMSLAIRDPDARDRVAFDVRALRQHLHSPYVLPGRPAR
ncbi:serine hydroxymethyltransferase [Catenuloplanes indicus JCM 9534]